MENARSQQRHGREWSAMAGEERQGLVGRREVGRAKDRSGSAG